MQKFIARESINRYRRLLETETDENRLKTVRALLKAEEERLAELVHDQTERIVDRTSGQARWTHSRQELQARLKRRSGSGE